MKHDVQTPILTKNPAELDDDRIKPKRNVGSTLRSYFTNDVADHDGLFNGLVIPKKQANYLFALSWVSLASGLYAIYRGYYDLSAVPLGVWLTSINYWRHPDYSWRRYFDMAYVHLAMIFQIWRAVGAENMKEYYILLAVACLFFPIGVYFHQNNNQWGSTICHGQVHVFGNISNFVLYSGYVRSILSYRN